MKIRKLNQNTTNYGVGTLTAGSIRFAEALAGVEVPVAREPRLSGRKIDHSVSNLPDATVRSPKLSLKEAIARGSKGEFGSTIVAPNQIW